MTAYELSMQMRRLMKEGDHAGALASFKAGRSGLSVQELASNAWLISSVVSCLRKTGQGSHVEALFGQFSIRVKADCHPQILGAYGWVLYDRLKALSAGLADESADSGEEVESPFAGEGFAEGAPEPTGFVDVCERADKWLGIMCDRMEGFEYMVVTKVLQVRVKAERVRPRPEWTTVWEVLGKFRAEQFKLECETVRQVVKGVEREVEHASDRERWYGSMILVSSRLGRHVECRAMVEEAMGVIPKLHYGNEVWFARCMALTDREMGDRVAAIRGLEGLLRRKEAWFMRRDVAELLWAEGRLAEALVHCRLGMAGHGELRFKVGLMLLTARVLREMGDEGLWARHLRLWQLVRMEAGWVIPASMEEELSVMPMEVKSIDSMRNLVGELMPYWRAEGSGGIPSGRPARPDRDAPRVSGRILRLLHDNEKGVDGFIQSEVGERAYFICKPPDGERVRWVVGAKVTFQVVVQQDGRLKAVSVNLA
jgi:hypothetical protein